LAILKNFFLRLTMRDKKEVMLLVGSEVNRDMLKVEMLVDIRDCLHRICMSKLFSQESL